MPRLDCRLQLLTGGARDLPERQQTLRNTLKWSYDLLDGAEQQLFRRLSVFVGGCTLEAVETICAAPDDGSEPVLDTVSSLVDKSLLQRKEQGTGEGPRFVMLETIHEYGLECLSDSGEMERVREAHAAYFLRLAETAEPELQGQHPAIWWGRLEREYDNLRAAMHWWLREKREQWLCAWVARCGGSGMREALHVREGPSWSVHWPEARRGRRSGACEGALCCWEFRRSNGRL